MPHLKPDPDSQCDLDYTPQFYCQLCGAGVPAVRVSENKVDGGVVREITCPICHCRERVGIQLAEDFSGWVFFQTESPDVAFGPDKTPKALHNCAKPSGQKN